MTPARPMKHIAISINLCDPLNPGFGYSLRIENAQNGVVLLHTSVRPDTGADLLTAADCLEVAAWYASPAPAEMVLAEISALNPGCNVSIVEV